MGETAGSVRVHACMRMRTRTRARARTHTRQSFHFEFDKFAPRNENSHHRPN